MTMCFVFGLLQDDALREIVLGEAPAISAAYLPDHEVVYYPSPTDLFLARAAGGQAPGLLFEVDATALARLAIYLRSLGGRLRESRVIGPEGACQAMLFHPAVVDTPKLAQPWSFADFDEDDIIIERAAAAELMALEGRAEMDPDELARRRHWARARAWGGRIARAAPRPRSRPPGPGRAAVTVTEAPPLHLGFFRADALQIDVPRFDGSAGGSLQREALVGYDAALVLPYDPARDTVLLVEQFRAGLWRRGDKDPWSLEPVAGMVDAGERPEDTAHREAREEADLTLSRLLPAGGGYASPGYSTDYFHLFVGLADLEGKDGHVGGLASEAEDIRAHVLPYDAAVAMVESGEINVLPLVTLLLWLGRNREKLRALG